MIKRDVQGSTLIEVLVTVLILSFGLLALGGMMAFAVQMPKLAGYRTTATMLAASHVEKVRRNANAFRSGEYARPLNYNGSFSDVPPVPCEYPNCTEISLADMDHAATSRSVRKELPAGGLLLTCDPSPCAPQSQGNLWIVWQEPATNAILDAQASDNCPPEVTSTFTNPKPRCLYVRFVP